MSEARRIDQPQPGFYRVRLVKGGPWVGARISFGPARDPDTGDEMDRGERWLVEIDGQAIRPPSFDPWDAGCERVWIGGQVIDEAEYRFLVARGRYAKDWTPGAPEARPREAIDINAIPAIEP